MICDVAVAVVHFSLFLRRQFDPLVNLFDTKFSCFTFLPTRHHRLATFRLQFEDDYEYTSLLTKGFDVRAQNLKLVHIVVLVLQSEGRYS